MVTPAAAGAVTAVVAFLFGPFVPNAGGPDDMLPEFEPPKTTKCDTCEENNEREKTRKHCVDLYVICTNNPKKVKFMNGGSCGSCLQRCLAQGALAL
jgi:hypothetical protein